MRVKKTVLVADQDSEFVRDVQVVLEEDYHVVVTESSEDALETAVSIEADLVVLEWRESHQETFARSRARGRGPVSPRVVVVFQGEEEARRFGGGPSVEVERWVKPVNPGELRSAIATFLKEPGDPSVDVPIQGRLEQLPLADLFQVLSLNRHTGCLNVRSGNPEGRGRVYVREGMIREAWLGDVSGVKALYRILEWESGSFEFVSTETGEGASIDIPIDRLLMQAAREKDELNELRPRLPRPNDRVAPTVRPEEAMMHLEGTLEEVFAELGMGGRVGALADASCRTDGVFYPALLHLIDRGHLGWERSLVGEIHDTLSPDEFKSALSVLTRRGGEPRTGLCGKILVVAETPELLRRVGAGMGEVPGMVMAPERRWETAHLGTLGQIRLSETVALEVLGLVAEEALYPVAEGLREGCVLAMGVRADEEGAAAPYVEFQNEMRAGFELPVVEVRPEALERMDRVLGAVLRVIHRRTAG